MGPGWILRKGSKRQKLPSIIRTWVPLKEGQCPDLSRTSHETQVSEWTQEKSLFRMSNNLFSRFQLSYTKAFSVSINKEGSLKYFQNSKFSPIISATSSQPFNINPSRSPSLAPILGPTLHPHKFDYYGKFLSHIFFLKPDLGSHQNLSNSYKIVVYGEILTPTPNISAVKNIRKITFLSSFPVWNCL